MPTCEPVQCDQEDASGELRSVNSFGRRRRRAASSARDDLLLVQSIQITDKFGFNKHRANMTDFKEPSTVFMSSTDQSQGFCLNLAGVIISGVVFLAVQMSIVVAWLFVYQQRKRTSSIYHHDGSSLSVPGRTDSLCKLYETGYARRF